MTEDTTPGVTDLARAMHEFRNEWTLDSVAITQWLPDGHMITARLAGEVFSIERDDGWLVTVPQLQD